MVKPYYRAFQAVIEKQYTLGRYAYAVGDTRNEAIRELNKKTKGFYHRGPVVVRNAP